MENQEVVSEQPKQPAPPADEKQGEQDVKPESSTGAVDAPEEPPKKKSGGFQKRIDKLTRTVYELQSQLDAARTPTPKQDAEPRREAFEDLETYQKALTEHTARKVIREYQAQEEQRKKQAEFQSEQAKRVGAWEGISGKASEKFEDAEDVLEHFASEIVLSQLALDGILESDVGSDIAYYLGKHEDEAARIGKLSPARQAIEIGKLEARLQAKPIKQPSKAAAPIDPVSGKGSAEEGPSDKDSDAEWIRKREAQLKASRKR